MINLKDKQTGDRRFIMTDLKQLYTDNEDFRHFVDECRKYDGRTVEEELKLKIIRNVAEFYHEKSKGAGTPDYPQQEA